MFCNSAQWNSTGMGGWEGTNSLCFAPQHNGFLVEWVGGKSELACALLLNTMEF